MVSFDGTRIYFTRYERIGVDTLEVHGYLLRSGDHRQYHLGLQRFDPPVAVRYTVWWRIANVGLTAMEDRVR